MTNGSLMNAESIAECTRGAICNTFDLHLAKIGLENQFVVFLRVAVLHRFYCTLYWIHKITGGKKLHNYSKKVLNKCFVLHGP